jgi:hypothetical protein
MKWSIGFANRGTMGCCSTVETGGRWSGCHAHQSDSSATQRGGKQSSKSRAISAPETSVGRAIGKQRLASRGLSIGHTVAFFQPLHVNGEPPPSPNRRFTPTLPPRARPSPAFFSSPDPISRHALASGWFGHGAARDQIVRYSRHHSRLTAVGSKPAAQTNRFCLERPHCLALERVKIPWNVFYPAGVPLPSPRPASGRRGDRTLSNGTTRIQTPARFLRVSADVPHHSRPRRLARSYLVRLFHSLPSSGLTPTHPDPFDSLTPLIPRCPLLAPDLQTCGPENA